MRYHNGYSMMNKEIEARENRLIGINLKEIKEIDGIKALGSFINAKKLISAEIGVPLKANSWIKLFENFRHLSEAVETNSEKLNYLLSTAESSQNESGKFNKVKINISEMLGFTIKARSWSEFRAKIKTLLSVFSYKGTTDKYELYEKFKRSNFIGSSKLEGINISIIPTSRSMSEVIKKYKVEI